MLRILLLFLSIGHVQCANDASHNNQTATTTSPAISANTTAPQPAPDIVLVQENQHKKAEIVPKTVKKRKSVQKEKANVLPVEVPTQPVLPVLTLPAVQPVALTAAPDHILLDSILSMYVDNSGKVDYKGLKNDKTRLNAYCQLLADNPVKDDWSSEEKMAYWINAYNAFTLKLIVDNYPTKSILNFDDGKTWDVKRIKLGDKKYSLNQIENDILRPQFKDARIHFAINCAAKSCPPLHNRAYTPENLETTLESRTKAFVNDKTYNALSAKKIQVSKIFDWYAVDFGDLRKFLNKYSDSSINSNATIVFNEYDWNLNQ